MNRATASETPVAVTIRDLTHEGVGVADVDGRRVFVPGALPAERVLIAPRRRRRRYQEAELVDVVEASPDRVPAPCEYFGICGGCVLQHLSYAAQVRFKQTVVAEAFARIAALEPERWLDPILGPQWGYRRRARLGVKYVEAKGRVLVGFRERSAPLITDMRHCAVLAPPLDTGLEMLAEVIEACTLKRRIPQIEVALGDASGAIVIRVLEEPALADIAAFRALGARLELDVHLQPGGPGTAASIMEQARPLSYELPGFGLKLEFTPTDFVQINAAVNVRMVEAAVELAELKATDRVLDLFCGIGNFSLPLATRAAHVTGVEGDAGLVARAASNAQRNGLAHTTFIAADLALPDWRFYREPWDVVVLDPPRTGAEAVVAQMSSMRPRRVVYVSCHPGTLARDARVLVDQGYRLASTRILDMFPHTHHVEAMAVFERGR